MQHSKKEIKLKSLNVVTSYDQDSLRFLDKDIRNSIYQSALPNKSFFRGEIEDLWDVPIIYQAEEHGLEYDIELIVLHVYSSDLNEVNSSYVNVVTWNNEVAAMIVDLIGPLEAGDSN